MTELAENTQMMAGMQKAIQEEKQQRQKQAGADQLPLILKGKRQEALENLIFFTPPTNFPLSVNRLLQQVETAYSSGTAALQSETLSFLAELVLALSSLLPRWNLASSAVHGQEALSLANLKEITSAVQALGLKLAGTSPQVEMALLDRLKEEAAARYKAEQAPSPAEAAKNLVGESLASYLTQAILEISQSQLRRIAEMRFSGETATELSNDYAAFLQYALYLGVSFATTNPPLVNMAWDALPGHWNPVIDTILQENPSADAPLLAKLVTLEVVLAQMRLLRPIFLLSDGRMGCVCFQVDPGKQDDARGMAADALYFYEKLRTRLGGIPNVVFKLPGTHAGLEACRLLTSQGIGVTITVDFAMFQHIPFARAILEGQAIFSCLVEMNGRLSFPVRDELLGKLDQLAEFQIDEKAARQAAAWAGVFVVRRLYQLLRQKGVDQGRLKILIASLRIYTGEMYQDLPDSFPDITGILGAEILSVFPNVRYAFDHSAEIALNPNAVKAPIPEHLLDILSHSEIFKQAYAVSDQDWQPNANEAYQPEHALALEDEEKVFAWPPIYNTLTEFMKSYQTLIQRLEARRESFKTSA